VAYADFTEMKIKNLYDVRQCEDFHSAITSFFNESKSSFDVEISELCYLKENNWNKILFDDINRSYNSTIEC